MATMSEWVIPFISLWLAAAIAVDHVLKNTPPGSGRIKSFRMLWVVGSLAGLGLILTGVFGYMLVGTTMSAMNFWVIVSDHLNQKQTG